MNPVVVKEYEKKKTRLIKKVPENRIGIVAKKSGLVEEIFGSFFDNLELSLSGKEIEELEMKELDFEPRLVKITDPKKTVDQLRQEAVDTLGIDTVNKINIGVCGSVNTGKSTLINCLRGLEPNDSGAVTAGTTEVISPDPFPERPDLVLWEIPGSYTLSDNRNSYLYKKKLYLFDFLIITVGAILIETDLSITEKAFEADVPFAIVRSRCDEDLKSELKHIWRKGNKEKKKLTLRSLKPDFCMRMKKNFVHQFPPELQERITELFCVSSGQLLVMARGQSPGKYSLDETKLLEFIGKKIRNVRFKVAHSNIVQVSQLSPKSRMAQLIPLKLNFSDFEEQYTFTKSKKGKAVMRNALDITFIDHIGHPGYWFIDPTQSDNWRDQLLKAKKKFLETQEVYITQSKKLVLLCKEEYPRKLKTYYRLKQKLSVTMAAVTIATIISAAFLGPVGYIAVAVATAGLSLALLNEHLDTHQREIDTNQEYESLCTKAKKTENVGKVIRNLMANTALLVISPAYTGKLLQKDVFSSKVKKSRSRRGRGAPKEELRHLKRSDVPRKFVHTSATGLASPIEKSVSDLLNNQASSDQQHMHSRYLERSKQHFIGTVTWITDCDFLSR